MKKSNHIEVIHLNFEQIEKLFDFTGKKLEVVSVELTADGIEVYARINETEGLIKKVINKVTKLFRKEEQ